MSYYWLFLFLPLAYLFGNINFSILISKFKLKKDIRAQGSGNPGATNMLRNFGFKWGLAVLLLDMLKGAIPTLIGLLIYGGFSYSIHPLSIFTTPSGQVAMYSFGLATILGHCFPVWTGFRGGKGVATTVGVFFVINPIIGFTGLVLGLVYGGFFGHASMSSFLFITFVVLWEGFIKTPGVFASILLSVYYFFILVMHWQNIIRLLKGNERRVSLFKKRSKQKIT